MTVRFKNELVRNITIKLGYANAKVFIFHHNQTIIDLLLRSTNAKTLLAQDRDVIGLIPLRKKTTRHAKDLDVTTG
jgi:translation initiation factor 2 gamma subunit (eIF-2gamma)